MPDLIKTSNGIYNAVHRHYNTRNRLTNAYAAAGLPVNPTQGEINQLNDSATRVLKVAVLRVVISALELGGIQDELGYPDIDAAIADAPNQVEDMTERAIVVKNLTLYKDVMASLASMTDKNLVMSQIVGAKGVLDVLESDVDGDPLINHFIEIGVPIA